MAANEVPHSPKTFSGSAKAWDQGAEGWYQHSALIHEWLREATDAMLDAAHIEHGHRVLDLAAGAADQTLALAARVGIYGQILATDLSELMLEHARRTVRDAGLGNVTTLCADLQTLGLQGAGFDAALCRMGLMFCEDPLQALREVRAALKPGGRLSALVFADAQSNPCISILMNVARRCAGLTSSAAAPPGSLLSLGPPGLLGNLLNEAGFERVNVCALSAPFRLLSVDQYIEFVRSSGSPIKAILSSLNADQQAQAWQQMTESLRHFEDQTGWCGPNTLLLCSASNPVDSR